MEFRSSQLEPEERGERGGDDPRIWEGQLLGSFLQWADNPDGLGQALTAGLAEEHFGYASHRPIFRAIVDLWSAGQPVDAREVARIADLSLRWGLKGVSLYLAGMLLEARFDCSRLILTVIEEGTRRMLREELQHSEQRCKSPDAPIAEILAEHESAVGRLASSLHGGEALPIGDCLRDALLTIEARGEAGGLRGCRTGFDDLDALTSGFQPGELIIMAARPSVGKTAVSLCFARNAAQKSGPVLFASLEQNRQEVTERFLSAVARVTGTALRSGSLSREQWDRLISARNRIANWPLWVDDRPGQSVLRIAATARRVKARGGLALVVVDYLQLISPENRREPRQEQVAGISRRLKLTARELGVPVLCLAQLNRQSENRLDKTPKLSDLRESGAIEQDADTVILLHRPDEPAEGEKPAPQKPDAIDMGSRLDLIIAKHRNGPTGEVNLLFKKSLMHFEPYSKENGVFPD